MKIHLRSDWTTRKPTGTTALVASAVRYIAIHWPGSAGSLAGKSVAALLRGWQTYHMNTRGWRDIAYSEAVDLDGEGWILRGNVQDGSVVNMGGKVYSILAVLGNSDTPTAAMLTGIAERVAAARERYPNARVVGHRDLKSTDCPGSKLHAWIKKGMPLDTPAAEPPTEVAFRFGVASQQEARWDGPKDPDGIGESMAEHLACSICVTTETTVASRKAIAADLGSHFRCVVHPNGSLAIWHDSTKWPNTSEDAVRFGSYHGALKVRFTAPATGQTMDVIGVHVRPTSIATNAQKESDLRAAFGLVSDPSRSLLAGDFNYDADKIAAAAKFSRATPKVDSVPGGKNQFYDAIYLIDGGLIGRRDASTYKSDLTDHLWMIGNLTLKGRGTPETLAFPLPSGYYFGPRTPTTNTRSVSGYYSRAFNGKTDKQWLATWQTKAKALGAYAGEIDGLYGPLTAAAAKTVQRRAELAVDGLIGKDTWPATWKL